MISLWQKIKPKNKLGLVSFIFFSIVLVAVVLFTPYITQAESVNDADKGLISQGVGLLSRELSSLTIWIAGLLLKLTIFCLKFVI